MFLVILFPAGPRLQSPATLSPKSAKRSKTIIPIAHIPEGGSSGIIVFERFALFGDRVAGLWSRGPAGKSTTRNIGANAALCHPHPKQIVGYAKVKVIVIEEI